jgi:hypothetical protein
MRNRKLRIVWSVAWGLVCVLLIALWVRSYWWEDTISYKKLGVLSNRGTLYFGRDDVLATSAWSMASDPATYKSELPQGIGWVNDPFWFFIYSPHYIIVVMSAAIAVLPWLRWRFSLRTLLIAMTLVAVVLGLIVWLRS